MVLLQNITILENKNYSMNDSLISIEFETKGFSERGIDLLFIYLDNKLMSKLLAFKFFFYSVER